MNTSSAQPTSKSHLPRLACWRLALGSILIIALQCLMWDTELYIYDEGIILTGAQALQRGLLPYRDFWTMYAPGQFYLTAWLFSIFGQQEYLVRVIGIVAKTVIILMASMQLRRFAGRNYWRRLAIAGTGIVVLLGLLIGVRFDAFPAFPATVFAVAALILMENALAASSGTQKTRRLLAAGILTELVACFRHDLGFYTAAALSIGVAYVWRTRVPQPAWRDIGRALGAYAAGIAILGVPVVAYFLWHVPLRDLYENLVEIPAFIYPAVRRLPLPGAAQLAYYVNALHQPGSAWSAMLRGSFEFSIYAPFLAAIPALVFAALALRRQKNAPHPALPFVFLAALLCLAFTIKGLVRAHPLHMAQSLVLAVPVALLFLLCVWDMARGTRRAALALAIAPACALLLFSALHGFGQGQRRFTHMWLNTQMLAYCAAPAAQNMRCADAYSTFGARYVQAAALVRRHSAPGEPIYIAAGRHDKLMLNAVLLYFMADRPPATKWYELHPGVQTRAATQADMVAHMRRHPPRAVLVDTNWDDAAEPNASARSSGAHILDEWLAACYEEKEQQGSIHLLAPRAAAASDVRCTLRAQ